MSLPTFVTSEPFSAGHQVTLGEDEAHHIRVRRLDVGAQVALLDGQGLRGTGVLLRIARRNATVQVATATLEQPRRAVHLLLPIADRDRMLWLAEKAAELGAASWRPVQFRRSRSVAARGEGTMFTQKAAARMRSALEQSGSAWMPAIYPDATVDRAVAAAPPGTRVVLDAAGVPIHDVPLGPDESDITIVAGPEGGIEPDELRRFTDAGFTAAAIGTTILRFETAAVVALGIIQSRITARNDSPTP
jgi:16S rRNA (uracil1498-N3)-methyltransferase